MLTVAGCGDLLLDTSHAAPVATPAFAPTGDAVTDGVVDEDDAVTPRVAPVSRGALIEDERNTISVFQAASQATVYVTQKRAMRDWTRQVVEVPAGSGTGFVWDRAGHIVTNYHVVDGGRSFTVMLADGTELDATLVGGEPRRDIAVLKLTEPPADLTPIRLPPASQALQVGQKTVAIGNPFGLDNTLTVGVVSAIGRDVQGYGGVTIRDMVQTDASINPGNSGGPLLDSSAQLIGMNTMIFSRSGSSAGIGFAVPTKYVRKIVPDIIEYGRPQRVGLGVEIVHDQVARQRGIQGVIIESAQPGSPAHRAGLRGVVRDAQGARIGDVIVAVNGDAVRNFDDLYNLLDLHKPGETVTITVLRDGQRTDVPVPLYVLEP
jgi:S1-C subfamily serine protease